MTSHIRLFVGGTPEHVLPTRVLEYSVLRRTNCPVQVSRLWEATETIHIPEVTDRSNRPRTSFSFQRFLIPELCGFEGRGIYMDSDMVVLADVSELWDWPMPSYGHVLVTPKQSAVMVIENSCGWKIAELVDDLNAGRQSYKGLMGLRGLGKVPELPTRWNSLDRLIQNTGLLHYTNMKMQPWVRPDHPCGAIWEAELLHALADGFISKQELVEAVEMEFVRPSLALLVGVEPPAPDDTFVHPNKRRDRSQIQQLPQRQMA